MREGEEVVPRQAQGQLLAGLGRLKCTVLEIVQKVNDYELLDI
jgi:hypothetical protein